MKNKILIGILLTSLILAGGNCTDKDNSNSPYLSIEPDFITSTHDQFSPEISVTIHAKYNASEKVVLNLESKNPNYTIFYDDTGKEILNNVFEYDKATSSPVLSTDTYKFKIKPKKDDWQDSYKTTITIREPNKNLSDTFQIEVS